MTANVTAAEFAGGYVYGYMTKDYSSLTPKRVKLPTLR